MADLLIELFSEEIPARMQARAGEDLKKLVTDGLVEAGLTYSAAAAFTTPRRLTLAIEGLPAMSPDTREERKGPRTDAPEKALEGFLRSTGLTKDQLEARPDKKGDVWFAVIAHKGRPAAGIVAEVLEGAVRTFPWPKSMRWGAGSLRWVRPLHSVLCILTDEHGASVVPLEIDGLKAGDTTQGHRFMAPGDIRVSSFEDYAARLKAAYVVLDPAERAETIRHDAGQKAFALGFELVDDKGLLAEVSGLVEWPVVLMGDIADEFIELPPEVLQTSMKEHQKFFSVKNPGTGRIEKFVTVANRETADDGATILAGNQKVLAARLADAKFFWENDLRNVERHGLDPWLGKLAHVTFHARLGSQARRIARIAGLAGEIAPMVEADRKEAKQAARAAKADLASEMVYEFPELQGIMGRYYARRAGFSDAVADAVRDHYAPLGPSDAVPSAPVSVAVALADKLDTLTGFWHIDEKPTGSKDPFALRRAALGVIRLVLENGLRLQLDRLIDAQILRHQIEPLEDEEEQALLKTLLGNIASHGVFGSAVRAIIDEAKENAPDWLGRIENHKPDLSDDLLAFIHDRLKVYLRDRGLRHDVIDACLHLPGKDDLALVVTRAEALQAVLDTDDGANLIQGFKRANNILIQAEEADGVEYSYGPDAKFAEDETETALFAALDAAEAKIGPAMIAENFEAAMAAMASLRGPIDAFFDNVQVNTDNQVIRRNRLNLLARIRDICLRVADLTRIEG
ncbi:glycine--tRNA ligase subunit beta [Sinisalibacter aestuarii]|uniref:Glycine--tRNA ligase beta subunit n=1 Tax=Sinisalibacter aestuarii TaxID=2949426 RepID=A0ABQ5LSF0_9RHOB|nr:glycine--tRNA ligase subunit beta [Sinisalibacter aestuarii]GKY87231.1 glycine--tRNA ligase beta subunit [Sinisalibacter aestuarii]